MKIRICASTNVSQSKTETEWFEVPDNLSEQEDYEEDDEEDEI